MMTLWGRANSLNVQKALWLLDEIGVEFAHIPLGGAFGGLDEPGARARNPHGRIPVLQDGDLVVWESHAILRYLAAARAPDRFWPAAPAARSHVDRWMDWAQASLQPDFLTGVFWGWFRTPPALRDEAAIAVSIAACAAHFKLLDEWLATRAFLCGEDFSLADIPAGALLYRYFELEIERPRVPHFDAWYRRLASRPAYRARVMVSFEDLRGRLSF